MTGTRRASARAAAVIPSGSFLPGDVAPRELRVDGDRWAGIGATWDHAADLFATRFDREPAQ